MGLSSAAVLGLTVTTVYAGTAHYTVHKGDCLYNIASKYHMSVAKLKSLNGLHSNLIYPGQKLVVQSTSHGSTKTTSYRTASVSSNKYTVRPGDSLWAISRRYHVSLSSLEGWNGLSSNSILHVGEKLTIKGGSAPHLSGRSGSPASASLVADMNAFELVQFAEQFTGTPYRWGGTTPSGFDCSGFVQYVFAHMGRTLPRTSYGQYGAGYGISKSDLKPGDIVFFDTYGSGASHDGIYVGNGQFINAASSRVEIDNLNSDYWATHYIGARRVSL